MKSFALSTTILLFAAISNAAPISEPAIQGDAIVTRGPSHLSITINRGPPHGRGRKRELGQEQDLIARDPFHATISFNRGPSRPGRGRGGR
ncbi:hypothetical protein CPB83DRAFT_907461 [Crepidotus variabilis]|uniref:Uncharacterized protein n=1 Tax=Crepidotus variabilis TaxID=179855 RepID=A0A9P6JPB9_9AGAR|nr:hypothetical protein CPB83DRAFT_907461 [Crepidotus variabilis]